jgi:predicted  nucleic acid-binding Zn-ribbon protein
MPTKKAAASKEPEIDVDQVAKEIFDKMKLRPNNTNGKGDKSLAQNGWADACFTQAFLTIMTASIGQGDAEWNRYQDKAWKINHEESKVRTAVNLLFMKEIEKQGVVNPPVTGILAEALHAKFHNTKAHSKAGSVSGFSVDEEKQPKDQPEEPKEPMPKVDIAAMREALASQHPLFAGAKTSTPPAAAKSNDKVVKPVEVAKADKYAGFPPPPPPPGVSLVNMAGAVGGAMLGAAAAGVKMAFGFGDTHHAPSQDTVLNDAASVGAPTHVIDVTEGNHLLNAPRPTTAFALGDSPAPMPSLHEAEGAPPPDASASVGAYNLGVSRRTRTVAAPVASAPISSPPPPFNPSAPSVVLLPTNTREVEELKAQLDRAERRGIALEERNNDLDKHINDQHVEITNLRKQLEETTEAWNEEIVRVAAKDKEINEMKETLLKWDQWGKEMQAKVTALESAQPIDKQVEHWMLESQRIQREFDQLETDFDTVVKNANQQLADKDKEIGRLNHLLTSTPGKADLANSQQEVVRLQREWTNSQQEVARLQKELATLRSAAPPPVNAKLQKDLHSAQADLNAALTTVTELNGRVQRRDQTITQLKAELDTLKRSPAPQASMSRHASGASYATTATVTSVTSSPEYQVLLKKWEAAEQLVGQLQAQMQTRVGGSTPAQQALVDARLASRQSSSSFTPSPFTYRR